MLGSLNFFFGGGGLSRRKSGTWKLVSSLQDRSLLDGRSGDLEANLLGSIRGTPQRGPLLNPTYGSLKRDLIERVNMQGPSKWTGEVRFERLQRADAVVLVWEPCCVYLCIHRRVPGC